MFKIPLLFQGRWRVQIILLVINLCYSAFGIYTYFANYNLSKNLITDQVINRELVLARSGSTAIQTFFSNVEQQLIDLTTFNDIARINTPSARDILRNFMDNADIPVNEILLYDPTGKLIIAANRQKTTVMEGQSFGNAPFIQWSIKPENFNKVLITPPYIDSVPPTKGSFIVVAATPLSYRNSLSGILVMKIIVDKFKKTFIDPLGNYKGDEAFIANTKGVLVAGNKALLNVNLIDYAKKHKWKGSQEFTAHYKKVINKEEVSTTWIFENPDKSTHDLLVTSNKIDIENTDNDLFLIVTHSKSSITTSLTPLYAYGAVWLVLGLITSFIGTTMVIAIRYVIKIEQHVKGYIHSLVTSDSKEINPQ